MPVTVPPYSPPYLIPSSVGLTVTQIPDLSIFQRATVSGSTYGKGRGNVKVTVNLAQPAMSIDYRLRDAVAGGNPVLQDWAPGAYAISAGQSTITLGAVPVRLGWYYVDLRVNGDNSQITLGTTRVAVGRLTAVSGQSLAARVFGRMDGQTATLASLGVVPSPYGSVYATYFDTQRADLTPAWAIPADGSAYDATFCAEYLRLEVLATGINCGLIGHAVGQTSILTWIPGGSNNAQLHTSIAGAGGAFEAFIWIQGHADAGTGMSNATYQANMTLFFNDMASINALGSGFTKLIASIPSYDSGIYGTATVQVIRLASQQWALANGGVPVTPMDLDLVDGIHQTMLGGITLARHFYRASRPPLGLSGVGDAGPLIVSAARRVSGSATMRLSVAQAGGTAFSIVGNPANRFTAFNSRAVASPLTISSLAVVSPTEIDLVLSAAPADTQPVDVWTFYPPDPSFQGEANMLYDNNVSDGGDGLALGRHIQAIFTPILVDCPSASLSINTPSTMSPGTAVTITGNYYGPAPTGLNYEFGSGGFVAAPTPTIVGNTWSFTITAPGTPATTTLTIQEANATGVTATSPSFVIGNTGPTATMTSPTYGTGKFNQGLTAGWGAVSPGIAPAGGIGTYECWVKTGTVTQLRVAFSQLGCFYLGVSATGFPVGAYGNSTATTVVLTGPNVITDGNFHHLALVVSSSGGTLFVDGVLVATSATPPSAAGVINTGAINLAAFSGIDVWAGTVDECALFNTQRYTASFTPPSAPYVGNETGLIACWHLDGDGTSV